MNKQQLKAKFQSMGKPNQNDFAAVIDNSFNLNEDKVTVSLLDQTVLDSINNKADTAALDAVSLEVAQKISATEKGAANGVAPLDSTGKIPLIYIGGPSPLMASITGNQILNNSAADLDVLTLQIPAGQLSVGNVLEFYLHGAVNKSVATASNLFYWIKVNGAKVPLVTTALGGTAFTNRPISMRGSITVRQLGSGTITNPPVGILCVSGDTLLSTVIISFVSPLPNADTNNLLTITLGCNVSLATSTGLNISTAYIHRIN